MDKTLTIEQLVNFASWGISTPKIVGRILHVAITLEDDALIEFAVKEAAGDRTTYTYDSDVSRVNSDAESHHLQTAALARFKDVLLDHSRSSRDTADALAKYRAAIASSTSSTVEQRIAVQQLVSTVESALLGVVTGTAAGHAPQVAALAQSAAAGLAPEILASMFLEHVPPAASPEAAAFPDLAPADAVMGDILRSHLAIADELAAAVRERDALRDDIRQRIDLLHQSQPAAHAHAVLAVAEAAAQDALDVFLATELAAAESLAGSGGDPLAQLAAEEQARVDQTSRALETIEQLLAVHGALAETVRDRVVPETMAALAPLDGLTSGLLPVDARAVPHAAVRDRITESLPPAAQADDFTRGRFPDAFLGELLSARLAHASMDRGTGDDRDAAAHALGVMRAAAERPVGDLLLGDPPAPVFGADPNAVAAALAGHWAATMGEIGEQGKQQERDAAEAMEVGKQGEDVADVYRETTDFLDGKKWAAALGLDAEILKYKKARQRDGGR
ncbi:hypothetical protein H9P43_007691 [Blastocladiella emersonii ATCC 22665]|nr:hypothetical protein H9P43_007691 [Blastocladiella emersonii ATCC 22665]